MRTLLIDTDVLVYRFAYTHEHAIAWDEDTWTYEGDLGGAKRDLTRFVEEMQETLAADAVRHFLSDTKGNWRRELYPRYKGHRAGWKVKNQRTALPDVGPRRPLLHKPLREWLLEQGAEMEEFLEGDDLMGIAATEPVPSPAYTRIIVSTDKDMKTVPGWHVNPSFLEDGVFEVTPAEAAYNHLFQTLMGDATDGYPGCKGIGEKRAAKILEGVDCLSAEAWPKVVATYEKAGLTEDDALMNARLARVLQATDYDAGVLTPWEPVR